MQALGTSSRLSDETSMLTRITFIVIILVALIPAAGFALFSGAWPLALPCVALGALWLIGFARRWEALGSLMLFAFIIAAGVGVSLSPSVIWAPPTVVLALAAWDLERFGARLRLADASSETRELERRHLWRLLAVSGLSLALAWAALGFRLKLGMAVALALGFLAILGLSQVIRALARESD
jgi:hypothetical protein